MKTVLYIFKIFIHGFQVLLADKLDDDIRISYTAVVSPLFVSFITLILMSFGAKGGNKCKKNQLNLS